VNHPETCGRAGTDDDWGRQSPRRPREHDSGVASVLRALRERGARLQGGLPAGVVGLGPSFLEGITLERLDREGSVRLNVSPDGSPVLPFAQGGFGTPSGKCEFGAETLEYTPPIESRHGDPELNKRFPLEMISSKNDDSMNSTFGNREAVGSSDRGVLHIHETDCEARGIRSGDRVRTFNDRGSLILTADVDGAVPPE